MTYSDAYTPFLRTIMEHPHANGPRLVFADFLDEHGDTWGKLIRLQSALADGPYRDKCVDDFRVSPPHYTDDVALMIDKCERLLNKETSRIVGSCLTRFWRDAGSLNKDSHVTIDYKAVDGDLIWWREPVLNSFSSSAKLFIWRGFPERVIVDAETWLDWNHEIMGAFPIWFAGIKHYPRNYEAFSGEEFWNSIPQYAGKHLTTLDMPYLMPRNAFTAWVCNILDACGEACQEHAKMPFTLKIGQAIMGGQPHSAAERWDRYCESFLKNSNVRIISRLQARSAVSDIVDPNDLVVQHETREPAGWDNR